MGVTPEQAVQRPDRGRCRHHRLQLRDRHRQLHQGGRPAPSGHRQADLGEGQRRPARDRRQPRRLQDDARRSSPRRPVNLSRPGRTSWAAAAARPRSSSRPCVPAWSSRSSGLWTYLARLSRLRPDMTSTMGDRMASRGRPRLRQSCGASRCSRNRGDLNVRINDGWNLGTAGERRGLPALARNGTTPSIRQMRSLPDSMVKRFHLRGGETLSGPAAANGQGGRSRLVLVRVSSRSTAWSRPRTPRLHPFRRPDGDRSDPRPEVRDARRTALDAGRRPDDPDRPGPARPDRRPAAHRQDHPAPADGRRHGRQPSRRLHDGPADRRAAGGSHRDAADGPRRGGRLQQRPERRQPHPHRPADDREGQADGRGRPAHAHPARLADPPRPGATTPASGPPAGP